MSKKFKLRFSVGDRVLACHENEWREAVVTKLWSDEGQRQPAPYRMRVSATEDDIYTMHDENDTVRSYTELGLPRLLQSIACGDEWSEVQSQITRYSVDVGLVGANLLLQAASGGNTDVVERLIDDYNVPESTCDKDGRNILFTALLHKQADLVDFIAESYPSLAEAVDGKGFNVVHYMIMMGDADYLRRFLNGQQFPSLPPTRLTSLVDTHNKRFGCAEREKTSSTPTPLEWAKRTKKTNMVQVLEKFAEQLRVAVMFNALNYYGKPKIGDDDQVREMTQITSRMLEKDLIVGELYRVDAVFSHICAVATNCSQEGKCQSLRYLFENFLLPLRESSLDSYDKRIEDCVNNAIRGPDIQAFPLSVDQPEVEEVQGAWANRLNALCLNWEKNVPVLKMLQMKLEELKEDERRSFQDETVVNYLEKTIMKAEEGVLIAERAAVLEYLMTLRPTKQRELLPVHEVVVQGQLHLLQWAVRAGHIDLKSPVGACPSLVEHVHTLSWLTLETKRKNKARGIPGDLTVAEVLCALAAGYGEFFIFQWLLEEVIPPARHGVTFNGKGLLFIASTQNRLVIVQYIVDYHTKVITGPFATQLFDAMVASFQNHHAYVGRPLLKRFPALNPPQNQWLSLIAFGLQSYNYDLSSWAQVESLRIKSAPLMLQIEAGASFEELKACFEAINLLLPDKWHLEEIFVTDWDELEPSSYSTDIKEAFSADSLFSCLATGAVRAGNLTFVEYLLMAAENVLYGPQISVGGLGQRTRSFLAYCVELARYAEFVNQPVIAERLTSQHAGRVARIDAARQGLKENYNVKVFRDMYDHFQTGAAVDVLEDCLQQQQEETERMNIPYEKLKDQSLSLEYLMRVPYNYFERLTSNKYLHIIRWLLETKGVKIPMKYAEKCFSSAGCAGDLEIVQYFLHHVYIVEPLSPYLELGGRNGHESEARDAEKNVLTFPDLASRAAYSVRQLMCDAAQRYSYDEENESPAPDPYVAVLDCVLTHALDKNYLVGADHCSCADIVEKAVKRLQKRDHPDMWAFLRRFCSLDVCRKSLQSQDGQDGGLLTQVIASTFYWFEEKEPASHDLCLRLVTFLLEQGVSPDAAVHNLVYKCANIFSHDEVKHLEGLLSTLVRFGADIQRVVYVVTGQNTKQADSAGFAQATKRLEDLKAAQRQTWKVAEAVAAGHSVDQLRQLLQEHSSVEVSAFRNRLGQGLLEVAALHDRGDVILWLHREHQMDIRAVNREGLSVLLLCRRAGSLGAAKVVAEIIGGDTVRAFCWRHFHRRRALRAARAAEQQRVASAVKVQSCVRGRLVRGKYAPLLREVKGSWNAFLGKWGGVLSALKEISTQKLKPFSWAEQKFKYDMAVDVSEQDVEVQNFLDQAASSSVRLGAVEPSGLEFSKITISGSGGPSLSTSQEDATDPVDAVELSQAVVRWLDKADETYRAMFHKKVTRLAQGSRSYALSKRLKGCEYYICESKLDAGQRILWTYISRDDKQHVLVWFVSKHDNVSRCARLIDNACARTFRSLNRAVTNEDKATTNSNQLLTLTEDSVLLDPSRNVPMKIYIAQRSELPLLAEKAWKAPLRLNQREQGVRSQTGTVLLLGRSGTGKTLCVMDRMNHDRAASLLLQHAASAPIKQLFVTRSSALCDFVRLYQQPNCAADDLVHTEYVTFDTFLRQLESASTDNKADSTDLSANRKVDFLRFRDHVFPLLTIKAARTLDALVVWTQIRSFLKGSIEAALEGGVLSLATYLDTSKFSRDRCRLLPEQRQEVYALFVQYQALHELHGWWDDMDRAMQVLRPNLSVLMQSQQLQENGEEAKDSTKVKYDKVYVDEVQDNTQVEIALYLVAVGGRVDALFLAGDPAQSVVEGVEFRFEEVRSLVYLLSQQQEALQRPTKLLVNYRSHSGILNCAGAVLGRMLAMFPGAAKTLPADEGLFLGPRPAFLSSSYAAADGDLSDVRKLLSGNERLVVLCPDERAADVTAQLSATTSTAAASNLVLGIRAAKGLEFTDIVLLDFFSSIPDSDYKAWKELLAVGEETSHNHGYNHGGELQQYAFPQLEPQLKLLYTGITRCINRLIFVESRRCSIGGLFFRWLKQHGLADAFTLTTSEVNVDGQQQQQQLMTRDEWRMRGIDIALSADGAGDLARSEQLLGQAAQCFQRAEEPALKAVAVAQVVLYQAEIQYCSISMVGTEEAGVEQSHGEPELSAAEEVAVASAVLRGLRAGLQQSSQHLCHLLAERLGTQSKKYFATDLLPLLNL